MAAMDDADAAVPRLNVYHRRTLDCCILQNVLEDAERPLYLVCKLLIAHVQSGPARLDPHYSWYYKSVLSPTLLHFNRWLVGWATWHTSKSAHGSWCLSMNPALSFALLTGYFVKFGLPLLHRYRHSIILFDPFSWSHRSLAASTTADQSAALGLPC